MSVARAVISGLMITGMALAVLVVGALTLFRVRRLYAGMARILARTVLLVYGVRLRVVGRTPFPHRQAVYISNHTSTLDLFVLVALGLPNCRFFLSGFLRKFVPLGIIATAMGTFFTVPQDRPEERRPLGATYTPPWPQPQWVIQLAPVSSTITSAAWASMVPTTLASSKRSGSSLSMTVVVR